MIKKSLFICLLGTMAAMPALAAPDRSDPTQLQVFSLETLRAQSSEAATAAAITEPGQRLSYAPPLEPSLRPVEYLKADPPRNLGERVTRLLQGVMVDIPPEYDHYGYEMRRYMASVAGPDVLGDKDRILQELKNIRKAEIVLQYWREAMTKEMSEIRTAIEEEKADSRVRTLFKYNQGVVNAFFIEAQGWIDSNENLLTFLSGKEAGKTYQYKDPYIEFRDQADRLEFITLFKAREEAKGFIHKYMPFKIMVY